MLADKRKLWTLALVALVLMIAVWAVARAEAEGISAPGGVGGQAAASNRWAGFYAGAHAGYGWGAWDGRQGYTDNSPAFEKLYGPFDSSSHSIDANGAIAGGQIGWNFQSGSIVWGIEADGSWSRLSGNDVLVPYPDDKLHGTAVGTPDWGFSIKNDWLATVRARLGVAAGAALFYGTGGVAFGGFSEGHTVLGYDDQDGRGGRRDSNEIGWAVGGGIELALGSNWSAKAEYLYYIFPDVGGRFTPDAKYGPATDSFDGDLTIHTVRGGLNYKF